MMERELEQQFEPRFRDFLKRLGATDVRFESQASGPLRPDFIVQAKIRGRPAVLLVECKSQGEPRYLRMAVTQLKEVQKRLRCGYPLIFAPYITDRSAALLDEYKVGYFDLAGNASIDYGPLFIRISGKPNPNRITRQLRSLFSPRSSRIIRVLLCSPERAWYVQELAKESSVSLGLVSKVKKKLLDYEYASEKERRLVLEKPGQLLDDWANTYSYENNRIVRTYSLSDPSKVEQQVAQYCAKRKLPYALTMFSGASKAAPFVRYNFAAFYFSGDLRELETAVELKEVPTGPNTWLLVPYDDGVYYGLQTISNLKVVSNVQLYLDLITFKGRGEEQAQAIREQLLTF